MSDTGPRFSLPVGEGVGSMLCLAAGDSAGGNDGAGYAATTQQAVVLAYHLLRHGAIDREVLAAELAELDGDDVDPSVFRDPSPELRTWLHSFRAGEVVLATDPSWEPAARVAPVGVWFRTSPDVLVESALETSRLTHLDAPSAVAATAAAGAVAAACFAQNGRDLLMAVTDVAVRAARVIAAQEFRFSRTDQIDSVVDQLRRATTLVGRPVDQVVDALGGDQVSLVVAGLVVAAPVWDAPPRAVEMAASIGGSPLAAMVGGVVGARTGVRVWPWSIANDTWFVALGQRLVAGETDLMDLPVPYAVEQRLTYARDARRI